MEKKTPSKKVLFTSHTANFSKFNRPFMRWFREQNWEVHYASAGEEDILDCDEEFKVPFERSPFKLNNLKAYRQLKKIIDENNYDIIHTHTPVGSVVTRLAARHARRRGTRVIYTAHGFHFFKGAPLLNWLIYYPAEKLMARYTDILITINKEDYARSVRHFRTRTEYVKGVGVDISSFQQTIDKTGIYELKSSLGLHKKSQVLFFAGELNKNKNQGLLIKSLARLKNSHPNLHLLLAGRGAMENAYTKLAIEKGVSNSVHFLGYRTDISNLLQITDVAVSSSYREGLPVNIIEAQAAKKPVVATRVRGNSDLIDDNVTGLLASPDDDRAFSQAVSKLLNNSSLRNKITMNAAEASKQYSDEIILEKMSEIYLKKTVLHLLPSNSFSGSENIAAKIIKKTEDTVTGYYCSPFGPIESSLEERSIPFLGLKKFSPRYLQKVIDKYRPDVIHAHDFKASMLASKFTSDAKIISHIHQNPEWINGSTINPKYILFRNSIAGISKIFTVSREIRESKLFRDHANVVTLLNTVDAAEIKQKSNEFHTPKYNVAFCGRLEPIKRPDRFVDAISKIKTSLPGIKAVMIGGGSLEESIKTKIADLGLGSNIDLVGFQGNPFPYIKNSEHLFITSEREGFSLVAAEAALLDAEVMTLNIPGPREIVKSESIFDSIDQMVEAYLNHHTNGTQRKNDSTYIKPLAEYTSTILREYGKRRSQC